jgi:putative methyltransferase (TIGR04325 family)
LNARKIAKSLTPPIFLDLRRRLSGRILRFSGRPQNWAEAQEMSTGYSTSEIFEHVLKATRTVVSGGARYERDSVLFDDQDFPFSVLAALLRVAVINSGHLNVLDFGGALGSTYRQCRPFLDCLARIDWWVVEQPAIVAAGRSEFTTSELHFAEHTADVPQILPHTVILASSVLQYMENPSSVIEEFGSLPARHLVIDRTPLSGDSSHRLCVQYVPKHIYRATYPCWILSHRRLLSLLSPRWRILSDFSCALGPMHTDDGMNFEYRGLVLEKKS